MRLLRVLLCLGLMMPGIALAQEEIGNGPDVETVKPARSETAPKPEKTAKDAKDVPPTVEDVPLPPAPPPGTMEDMPIAELQALDKITARVSHIEARIGQTVTFGSLNIVVKACRRAPPEDTPESAAFLVVSEQKAGEAPVQAYSGWMFASSPSLAAMDHPIYDIWVVECRKDVAPATAPAPTTLPIPATK